MSPKADPGQRQPAREPAPPSYPNSDPPVNQPGVVPPPGDSAPVVDRTQARGGETSNRVRWVLAVALLLVVIGFWLAYTSS
jgi:hypothetical protein